VNRYYFGANLSRYRTGLILGALIGLGGGFPWGVLFGALVGYQIDRLVQRMSGRQLPQPKVQQAFFDATFTVLGKLAKADGRVTRAEIRYAEAVMARMQLNDHLRCRAIDCFQQGKEDDYDINMVLQPLGMLLSNNAMLRQMFLEIQLQAAMIDGQFSEHEGNVLSQVCQYLGISRAEFSAAIARMRSEHAFQQDQQGAYRHEATDTGALKQAYGVLGLQPDCDNQSLKKAYRKLMSQNHPDKLVARGLPDTMMQLAKEKTQEIQAAYDLIKQARKN
jgi:DnaJ like chaperone protein